MKREKLTDLMEQRNSLRQKIEAADDADTTTLDALEADLNALNKRIARNRMLDTMDREEPGTVIHGSKDEKLSSEIRTRFSLTRALASKAGYAVDAGFENEIQKELARRAGKPAEGMYIPTEIFEVEKRTVTTATAGELVPTDFRPDLFISALTDATVIRGMGATVLTGLTGNVSIPRETDSPQPAWFAENSPITTDDPDFDSVTLQPRHIGVISGYSRNMLLQSSPQIESLLRNMMARNIARGIDAAAIRGAGAPAPTGILNTSGIQFVTGDTDLFTAINDAVALAAVANVAGSLSILTTPLVRKIAAKALDANKTPIGVSNVFGNVPTVFTNIETADGNSPNTYALVVGNFHELVVGIWSELDVLVNPFESDAFNSGNVLVRTAATCDVAVRHPASFVSVSGVNAATPAMPA